MEPISIDEAVKKLEQETLQAKILESEMASPFIDGFDIEQGEETKKARKGGGVALSDFLLETLQDIKNIRLYRKKTTEISYTADNTIHELDNLQKQFDELFVLVKSNKDFKTISSIAQSDHEVPDIAFNTVNDTVRQKLSLSKLKIIDVIRELAVKYFEFSTWEIIYLQSLKNLDLVELHLVFKQIIQYLVPRVD